MQKDKTKKFFGLFAILFVAIFSVGCVFATACGKKNKEEEEPHSHSYTSEITKQPTCTEKGETTYTCDCGDSYTEEIAALGHDYEAKVTTAATCTVDGLMTYTCSRCKDTYTEEIAALGHDYTVTFNWSGDDETGYTADTATYVCKNDETHTGTTTATVATTADSDGNTVYTATAKIDGKEYTDEKVVYVQGSEVSGNLFITFTEGDEKTYTADFVLGQNSLATVSATAGTGDNESVSIDHGTGSSGGVSTKTDSGLSITFTQRLKTGGEGTTEYRSIEFVLTDAADITVWMCSSNGDKGRTVNFFDENGKETGLIYQKEIDGSNTDKLVRWTISVETAGTYYLASDSEGLNIYGIAVSEYTGNYTDDVPSTESEEPYAVGIELSGDLFILDAGATSFTDVPTITVIMSDGTEATTLPEGATVEWSSDSAIVTAIDAGTGAVTLTGGSDEAVIEVKVTIDENTVLDDSYTIQVKATIAADDPVIGDWTGNASFDANVYGYDANCTANVEINVTITGITLKLYNVSAGSDMDFILGLLGINLSGLDGYALLEEEEWYKVGETYWVSVTDDAENEIRIEATVESDGLHISFSGTIAFQVTDDWLLEIPLEINDQVLTKAESGSGDVEPTEPEYSITIADATENALALEITGVLGSEDESFGSATLTAALYADGTAVEGTAVWALAENAATGIVTFDQDGKITAVSAGTTYLTVTYYAEDNTTVLATQTITVTVTDSRTEPETPGISNAERITLTEGAVELNGANTFENPASEDLFIVNTTVDGSGNVTYTLSGTAAFMTADEAKAFWEGHAAGGDAYIVVTIKFTDGETVSWVGSDGTTRTRNISNYEDGEIVVIIRISGNDLGEDKKAGYTEFKITDGDGNEVTYKVDFSDVVTNHYQAQAETKITVENDTAELNEVSFTNGEDVSIVYTRYDDGSERGTDYGWIWMNVYGTPNTMTAEQVAAFTSLGDTNAHDPYVIVTVNIKAGETLSTSATDYTYYADDTTEIFVIKVSNYGYWQFKITSETDSVGTMYVIDFTTMTPATVQHTAGTTYVYSEEDGYWYAACTECGEPCGEPLTSGEGITLTVTSYEELSAALALGGATVVLTENVSGALEVNAYDVTLTVEEGVTLSNGSDAKNTVTVTANAKLTINGDGTIDNVTHGKAAVYVEAGGEAVLNGGTYTRSSESGNSYEDNGGNSYYTIVNHGTVAINAGVVVKSTGIYSSMIENGWYYPAENTTNATATLTINGGTFTGGKYTVKNDDCGVLTIIDGTFTNSGATVIGNYGTLDIQGGTFTQSNPNYDSEYCEYGAGYVVWNIAGGANAPEAKILGGTFTGTYADVIILVEAGKMEISGGTFTGGFSTLLNYKAGETTISGGEFKNSLWQVLENYGTLTISGGTFEGDSYAWVLVNGWDDETAVVTITGGEFKAGNDSIVIAVYAGSVAISDGTFTAYCDEQQDWYYDVVYAEAGTVTISGGTFTGYLKVFVGTIEIYGGTFDVYMGEDVNESGEPCGGTITVYGGYFKNDPSDFLAEGYTAYESATVDGYWGVAVYKEMALSDSEIVYIYTSDTEGEVQLDVLYVMENGDFAFVNDATSISWSITDTSVATITGEGASVQLKIVGVGIATLTVTVTFGEGEDAVAYTFKCRIQVITDPLLGTWSGNMDFGGRYLFFTGTVNADITIVVDESTFDLVITVYSITVPMGSSNIDLDFRDSPLVLNDFLPFDWEREDDGTYYASAYDDAGSIEEIYAYITDDGELSIYFNSSIYIEDLGSISVTIDNKTIGKVVEDSEDSGLLNVSLDFTDASLFSKYEIIGADGEMVELLYRDGTGTGFYVTKCSSRDKYNSIDSQNNTQVLNFQGSAKSTQNSVAYTLAAGTYTISVSYFSGTSESSAGRYAVVMAYDEETGEDVYLCEYGEDMTDESVLTDQASTVKTRTVEITLEEETVIYIGSYSNGLYITNITITQTA